MRTHPHLVHPRQQSYISQQQQQQPSYMKPQKSAQDMQSHYDPYSKTHKRPLGGAPYLHQQRSFSSSEEELRSTPEFEGKLTACFCGFFLKTFSLLFFEVTNMKITFCSVSTLSFYFLSRLIRTARKIEAFKASTTMKKMPKIRN